MTDFTRRGVLQVSGAFLVASASAAEAAPLRLLYNENPFGPSERAKQAAAAALEKGWQYPYEDLAALRKMIAAHEGLKPENVIVTEGSGELLKLAALIHSDKERDVVVARPTFPMLAQYASRRGANIVWVDLDKDFRHDLAAMQARVNTQTGLVYVCNPDNPTGSLVNTDDLRRFIAAVSKRALTVVDEAYIDYADDPARVTVIDQVKAGQNLIITRSFSKIHGLAGLRIGYGMARADIIRSFESMRMSFPNRAGLAAARVSYDDEAFLAQSRQATRDCLDFTQRMFKDLRVPTAPTQASFLMFDTGRSGAGFVELMRTRNVLISPVTEPYAQWARVSMGRMEDMKRYADVMRTVFT